MDMTAMTEVKGIEGLRVSEDKGKALTEKGFDRLRPKLISLFALEDVVQKVDDIVLEGLLSRHLDSSHRAAHAITDEMFDHTCATHRQDQTSGPVIDHETPESTKMAHVEAMWVQLAPIDEIEQLALKLSVLTDVQTVMDRTLVDLGKQQGVAIIQTVDAKVKKFREGLAACVVQKLGGIHHFL